MFTRLFHPPRRSYFLLGPRGTGKTTWLKAHYKESDAWFDLLKPGTYLRLQRNPEQFAAEVAALAPDATVVLDEVQRLPRLLDDVHAFLAEPESRRRFVLTGSSARKLRRGGENLLAGRAAYRTFFPLVHGEHHLEDMQRLLQFGTLPEVLSLETDGDRAEFLDAYTLLYLREEIQQEAAARNIDSFGRFLELAALMHGQTVNVSALARDAGIARTTVSGYFQVLEDTLVGTFLRAFRPKLRVKETAHPKFYFFDPGVVRGLSGRHRTPMSAEELGPLFEGYLLHELRFWNQHHQWSAKLSYWSTPSGPEVDFIVERGEHRIGIELKASPRWRPEHNRALQSLLTEGKIDQAYGVYLGNRALKYDRLTVLPASTFFRRLADNALEASL